MSFFDLDVDESPASEWLPTPQPGRGRRARRIAGTMLGAGAVSAVVFSLVVPLTGASADPSASAWNRLRNCESSNDYSINTGNGYYGAYQFNLSTWRSVGGTGYPNHAARAEQDARALILYRERGWQPWTCAGILGLREDADARSGRIRDINPSGATKLGASDSTRSKPGKVTAPTASGVPAWPGVPYAQLGDHSSTVARWQAQMHTRGSFLVGTGYFGPNTLTVVKRIQGQNGLNQTGLLGPVTWKLAWTGAYRDSAVAATTTTTPTTSGPHTSGPVRSAPAFPGTRYWSMGDRSSVVARWQAQMHNRGSFLVGTGDFGPNTLTVVKRIQGQNGLPQTGLLGPVTWKLAWTGTYRDSAPASEDQRSHEVGPVRSAPAFPGTRYWSIGDQSSVVAAFQRQMHRRGSILSGTGDFGTHTEGVVKRLQRLNRLPQTGLLGPVTWKLAWTGRY